MQRVLAASTLNALCASATTVAWWQTARDTGDRLTPQSARSFVAPGPVAPNASVFSVNASQFFQTVWGFGGAMTESAVYVFNKLGEEAKAELLLDLYGENANGTSLRYTAGRLTIGSCDFALDYYNYNNKSNDTEMLNFTIAHDETAIIPFILDAQKTAIAAGRTLRFLSSPWSPPGWMKSNRRMSCFPVGPLDCALLPEFQPAWALYFSRYLSAYAEAGVDIWGITVQNEPEPQTSTLTYEGMWFPFSAELEFVAEYLGPQLSRDHPDTKIFIFDHNQKEAALYATPILADPVASSFVTGTAFHWYSGPDWAPLDELHDSFPDKLLLASEATRGIGKGKAWWASPDWEDGEYYGTFIIQDLLHWSIGFLDWNILLDQRGAPDHGDPTGELCEGLIPCGSNAMLIADLSLNPPVVYKQAFYWYMGHVSRFVPPGSIRLGSSLSREGPNTTQAVLGIAFSTPDSHTVVVLMNTQDTPEAIVLQDPRYGAINATMPPHSIQTWVY